MIRKHKEFVSDAYALNVHAKQQSNNNRNIKVIMIVTMIAIREDSRTDEKDKSNTALLHGELGVQQRDRTRKKTVPISRCFGMKCPIAAF